MIRHASIVPIADLDRWSQELRRIAAGPLEFCPDFPSIAERFEAWWNQALLDRPIFIGEHNDKPARPITRRLDLLDRPGHWLLAKLADMDHTVRVGDALPSIRVDFGPVMLGALLGGKAEFQSDTTWTHPLIDDAWSNAPTRLLEGHPWWSLLQELTYAVAFDAAGRYLVRTPDLGGSADVMLNLRGSSELCLDVLERPETVAAAIDAIYPAWHQAFCRLYEIALDAGAGVIHWLGLWSNRPHLIPACDFNYLIGPKEFERVCLPDIARQAATVGRACFHLDGAGAARHVDALLDVPDIQAIQFTPGSGAPSAMAWIEMFRRIQSRGRSVLVICPAGEVVELCGALRPEGLAVIVEGAASAEHLAGLFEQVCRRYRRS